MQEGEVVVHVVEQEGEMVQVVDKVTKELQNNQKGGKENYKTYKTRPKARH